MIPQTIKWSQAVQHLYHRCRCSFFSKWTHVNKRNESIWKRFCKRMRKFTVFWSINYAQRGLLYTRVGIVSDMFVSWRVACLFQKVTALGYWNSVGRPSAETAWWQFAIDKVIFCIYCYYFPRAFQEPFAHHLWDTQASSCPVCLSEQHR